MGLRLEAGHGTDVKPARPAPDGNGAAISGVGVWETTIGRATIEARSAMIGAHWRSSARRPPPIMTLPSLPFRSLTLFLLALLASGAPAQAAGPHAPAGVEIEADGPKGPLKGILLQPQASSSMVVLIIPGSGPTNRNGNGPNGLRASTYRLLAEALAEGGLSSVRVDKRGLFSSKAAVDDPNDVTLNAYATDVHAWVGAIRKKTSADCVWVLGHSEGGLVALTAARQPAGICGLILVATPGRRLAEVLREQLQANPANAPLLEQAMSAIGSLERGKRIDVTGMQAALLPLFRPAVQGFLIDLFNADPVALAQQPVQPTHCRRQAAPLVGGIEIAQGTTFHRQTEPAAMSHEARIVDPLFLQALVVLH